MIEQALLILLWIFFRIYTFLDTIHEFIILPLTFIIMFSLPGLMVFGFYQLKTKPKTRRYNLRPRK